MSGAKLKVLVTLIWIAFFALAVWTGYIYTEKYVDGKYDEKVESHGRMKVEYPVVLHMSGAENTCKYVLQPDSEYRQDRGNVLFVLNGMGLDTPGDMRIQYEVVMTGNDYIRYHIHIYSPSKPEREFLEFCLLRNGTLTTPGRSESENLTLLWTDERGSAGAEEVGFWEKIVTVYMKKPPEDTRRIFCAARYDPSSDKSVYMLATNFDVHFITYNGKYQTYTRSGNGRSVFNKTLSNADVEVYSVRMGVEPYTVIAPMTFYFYRNGTIRATYGILDESTGETDVKDCRILHMSQHEMFELLGSCDKDQSTQQPVYAPRSNPPKSSPTASPEPTRDVVRDMTDDLGKSAKDEIGELGDDLRVDLSDFSDIVDKIRDSG